MKTVELFFILAAFIFLASGIAFFVLKKIWLGLAIFGFGWVVIVIKDILLKSSALDLALDTMIAAIFIFQAVVTYRRSLVDNKTPRKNVDN